MVKPTYGVWQSIENAPMDGTQIILRRGSRVTAGSWVTETEEEFAWWCSVDGGFAKDEPPTHWMSLPNPPEDTQNG
jgi:hypothetical protein